MKKNDKIILEITDIMPDGNGVGKYDGMAVFVPASAVGDCLIAHVVKVKKSYAYARIDELITPSPDRIESDCPVFHRCGGCVYRHISYEAECRQKCHDVYEKMKRIGGLDIKPQPLIPARHQSHYRNKAQFPIAADGVPGFYAARTHRIVPAAGCMLQPEEFEIAANVCTRWIKENNIPIYREEDNSGLMRHIYLRKAQATGEIMLTAVINGERLPAQERLIALLCEALGERLKSVQININKEKTNVILGDTCRVLYGEGYITDILCGVRVRLSPLSFYQVNHSMAELLYKKAAEYAQACGKDILDLYCGAGTIGLSMADKAKSIIGVEIIPEAVRDAEFNAALNGIKNAQFLCGDAAEAAKTLAARGIRPSVVIVDPPRKGCGEELLTVISHDFKPERMVYVSCDPATLARDIAFLSRRGYCVCEYTPVDLFPRTGHVETIVLLQRENT